MVIHILTKFGADWLIFVNARVLTRKLWMDARTDSQTSDRHRRTMSDHNSSLSTPCSGALITLPNDKFLACTKFKAFADDELGLNLDIP